MQVLLYDTLTRTPKELHPHAGDTFAFYCCGPTVYGPAHIGNFRTFILQDILRRTLELAGIRVRHVRNLTDVDDKTIRESRARERSLADFTGHWRDRFRRDCELLGILPPHEEPGAVAHIPQQIALIERLIARGNAYVAPDGSVYFRVASLPTYGALSRLDQRAITTTTPLAAASAEDEYSRDSPVDFALWKARRPEDGPNHWTSPWGEGRPGWHIECSAMCMHYLGPTIDLHSGGADLVFPHHENEIAQSEAATGETFSRHWFHIAHLLVDGRKMSKSEGNLFTLDDLRARGYAPEEVRYLLASGNYRQGLNFTFAALDAARHACARLSRLARAVDLPAGPPAAPVAEPARLGRFAPAMEALLDDLDTPLALGRIFLAAREMERETREARTAPAEDRLGLQTLLHAFGLRLPPPAHPEPTPDPPDPVRALAERRWEAKSRRDWPAADSLRAEIEALGWLVKDSKTGYELSPARPPL